MHSLTDAGEARLESFLEDVGAALNDKRRMASFATYALGLLSESERKSVEPLAARAAGDPKRVDAIHQRLLHFLTDSDWDDRAIRRLAARYALKFLTAEQPVEASVIDDTGFLKQGTHSVGVHRQYTGSAGKIAKMSTSGSFTEYSLGSGHAPWGICAGPDGNLYFTDWVSSTNTGYVGQITTSGSVTEWSLGTGTNPKGICTGPDVHNTDLWGDAVPIDGAAWGIWPMGAA